VFVGLLLCNVDVDVYVCMICELCRFGVVCVVDMDGDLLCCVVWVEFDVILLNVFEVEELVGYEFNDVEDYVIVVWEMFELGVCEVIMIMLDGCYVMMCLEEL